MIQEFYKILGKVKPRNALRKATNGRTDYGK